MEIHCNQVEQGTWCKNLIISWIWATLYGESFHLPTPHPTWIKWFLKSGEWITFSLGAKRPYIACLHLMLFPTPKLAELCLCISYDCWGERRPLYEKPSKYGSQIRQELLLVPECLPLCWEAKHEEHAIQRTKLMPSFSLYTSKWSEEHLIFPK